MLRLLHFLANSLQANANVAEGRCHSDCLNDMASSFISDGKPVISVYTKRNDLLRDYANGGAEEAPGGEPERVEAHDFADPALGEFAKTTSYGIYDIINNEGRVNDGDIVDTSEIAVESIRHWWNQMRP
jgi:hypothetical protein